MHRPVPTTTRSLIVAFLVILISGAVLVGRNYTAGPISAASPRQQDAGD